MTDRDTGSHVRALRALVEWDGRLDDLRGRVDGFSRSPTANISADDLCNVLERFVAGQLDHPVSEWARAILMTDGITYEDSDRERIAETVFRLATPEIEGELSVDMANDLVRSLRRGHHPA